MCITPLPFYCPEAPHAHMREECCSSLKTLGKIIVIAASIPLFVVALNVTGALLPIVGAVVLIGVFCPTIPRRVDFFRPSTTSHVPVGGGHIGGRPVFRQEIPRNPPQSHVRVGGGHTGGMPVYRNQEPSTRGWLW